MIINLPKLGAVKFDDDLTRDEFESQLKKLSAKFDFELATPDYGVIGSFTRGVSRGAKRLGAEFGDVIPAMVGSALGADEYAQRQMGEYAQTQEEIERLNPAQFQSRKDVKGPLSGLKYGLETIGEQVPNIGSALIPGGVGRVIGGAAAKRAALAGVEEYAAQEAALMGAAETIAAKKALGQNVGVYLGSYAMNAPEIFGNIYQATGQFEPGAALLAGSVSAALDSVLPSAILSRLTKPAKLGIVEKILEKSGMQPGLIRKVIGAVPGAAATEGLTESAQEAISIAAEKYIKGNPQIFDSEDFERMIESGVRGAIAGGGISAVSAIPERLGERAEARREQDEKDIAEQERIRADEERKKVIADQAQQAPIQGQLFPEEQGPPVPQPIFPEEPTPTEAAPAQGQLFPEEAAPIPTAQVETTEAPETEIETEAAPAEVQEPIKATYPTGVLTKDAENLLDSVDAGGVPAMMTYNLRRIANENGIKVTSKSTPNEIIDALRAKLEGAKDEGFKSTTTGASDEVLMGREDAATEGAGRGVGATVDEYTSDMGPTGAGEKGLGFTLKDQGKPAIKQSPIAGWTWQEKTNPDGTITSGFERDTEAEVTTEGQPTITPEMEAQKTEEVEKAKRAIYDESAADAFDNMHSLTDYAYNTLDLKNQKEVNRLKKENKLNDQAVQDILRNERSLREEKIGKRLLEAGKKEQNINLEQSVKQGKEAEKRILKETVPFVTPDEVDLSEFQKELKGAKNVGEALKILLKKKLNVPQKALINALMRIPGIKELDFAVLKHPDARQKDSRLTRYEAFGTKIGEEKVTVVKDIKDKHGRVIDKKTVTETRPVYSGEYDEKSKTVKIYQSGTINTLLHEVVHAATAKVINNHIYFETVDGVVRGVGITPLGKKLMRMFDAAKEAAGKKNIMYGLQNAHEFVAEAFTNPDFQYFLKNTESVSKGTIKGKLSSLWSDFVNAIKDMLGVPDIAGTLLEDVLTLAPQLFKGPLIESVSKGETVPLYAMTLNNTANKSDVVGLINSSGVLYKDIPSFNEGVGDKIYNVISKFTGSIRSYFLGSMSLENLYELYKKSFPNIKFLDDIVKLKNKYHTDMRKDIDNIVHKGIGMLQKYPQNIVNKFNNVILEMSRLNIDPRKAENNNNSYVKEFRTLPKELQTYAIGMVEETYEKYSKDMLDFISSRLPNDKAAQLRATFESNRLPFYFPLVRKGNYWLQYTDPNGEFVSIARDNPREIQKIKEFILKKDKNSDVKTYTKITEISHTSAPPSGFVADIIKIMKAANTPEAEIDRVYQTYLSLFPTESLRQNFKERRGDPGYIQDVIQGFAQVAPRMATQLANLKYNPTIGEAYSALDEDFNKSSKDKMAQDVINELRKRKGFIDNPVAENWAYWLSNANFVMSIGGNLSSALINTTVLPMVVLPQLAVSLRTGKFDMNRAYTAMMSAKDLFFKGGYDDSKQYLSKKLKIRTFGMNPQVQAGATEEMRNLKDLYNRALASGVLTYSVGRDLDDISKTSSDKYSMMMNKGSTLLGLWFEGTERFNREVTLLAAYDLAKKDGFTHNEAMDKAITLTSRVHTEAVPEAGARWLQSGVPKVALTFKRFILAQILNMGMIAKNALAGEDPITKSIAKKQAAGIIGMTYLFAGIKGLPGYGAVNVLANFLASDDDEPFDLDQWIQDSVGTVGLNGIVNQITQLDIAARTGFENTLWRDDPKRLSEVGYLTYAMEKFAGPTFSTAQNFTKGVQEFNDGQYERGLEKMTPSFARNFLKAWRYYTEGAKDKSGAPVVEDISAWNQFMQIFGFSPTEVSEQYARTGAKKEYEQSVLNRRVALLDAMYLARSNNDTDAEDDTYKLIDKFNDKHPGVAITESTLNKSYSGREKAIERSVGGMTFNPKLMSEIEDKFGSQ
jgi:hypothetical protein